MFRSERAFLAGDPTQRPDISRTCLRRRPYDASTDRATFRFRPTRSAIGPRIWSTRQSEHSKRPPGSEVAAPKAGHDSEQHNRIRGIYQRTSHEKGGVLSFYARTVIVLPDCAPDRRFSDPAAADRPDCPERPFPARNGSGKRSRRFSCAPSKDRSTESIRLHPQTGFLHLRRVVSPISSECRNCPIRLFTDHYPVRQRKPCDTKHALFRTTVVPGKTAARHAVGKTVALSFVSNEAPCC